MTENENEERANELALLIESHTKMKEKGALTDKGISYLEGLEKAFEIMLGARNEAS